MSRIGNRPVVLVSGVTAQLADGQVLIKGPKGQLQVELPAGIEVVIEENQIVIKRQNDERQTKAFHGLVRSMVNNHIIGVSQGYRKTLKLVGTGYRVALKGKGLTLSLGFSHPIEVQPDQGITLTVEGNDTIHIDGIDKQAVGQQAANIRKLRPPEPYKGKGVRYEDEVVRRKVGKAAS